MDPDDQRLDPEARAALDAAGGRLLGQLDSLREQEAETAEGKALPPEARVALERRGELFLHELESRRQAAVGVFAARMWVGRIAKLVALALVVGIALKIAAPTPPKPVPTPPSVASAPDDPADPNDPQFHLHAHSPVPEPGTGALSVVGALMLAMRRRRPGAS